MTQREQLLEKVNALPDEQIQILLQFVSVLEAEPIEIASDNPGDDPLAGFLSGPADLAERSEEILQTAYILKNKGIN